MTWLVAILSFAAGAACHRALTAYRISQRQTARREFRFALGRPVEIEPTEFSANWEARP